MRYALPLLALLFVATAAPAAADELFVLDNGEVLRGWVISEDEETVQLYRAIVERREAPRRA